MTTLELFYYAIAFTVWIVLFFILRSVNRSESPYKKLFLFPILMAIITVPIYSAFVAVKSHFWAMLFNGLYYACTDWLAFSMLLFVLTYTWRLKEIKRTIIALVPILLVDTVSLIANAWTGHTFNLARTALDEEIYYWACEFTRLHYIHLAFCYVMVLASLTN